MKRILVGLLAVSAGVNVLLAVVAWRARQAADDQAALVAAERVTVTKTAATKADVEAELGAARAAVTKARSEVWGQLRSDDLPTLIANLRAAGFPEAQTRAIVAGILGERFAARRRELLNTDETPRFWTMRVNQPGFDPAKQIELRAMAREQRELLKQLLGTDATSEEQRLNLQRLYGPLPADKLEAVGRINSDYLELASQIQLEAAGMMLPEDRENLALLEQEKRKDLAGVLTPAELELFDLYSSATANTMRRNLSAFEPSESEFRAIFALQREFDEQFARPGAAGFNGFDDRAQERRAAEQKLGEQLRTALGEARYAEFQRAQDQGYRAAVRIAERYRLPVENANAVYTLQREAQQKLTELRNNREAAAGYARETAAKLNELLGAKGVEAYRQSPGSFWMRNLDRFAASPGTAPRG